MPVGEARVSSALLSSSTPGANTVPSWAGELTFARDEEPDLDHLLDDERALELDALAQQILKRRFIAPKTLVGLGVPDSAAAEGATPNTSQSEPSNTKQRLNDEQRSRPSKPSPLGETQKHAFAPIAVRKEQSGAETEAVDHAEAQGKSKSETALGFDATQERPAEAFSTIAPPPPEDAAELEVSALPATRRYDLVPRAAAESARRRTPAPTSDAPWAVSNTRRAEPQLVSRLALIGLAFAASLAATLWLVNSLLPSRKGNLLVTAAGPNQVRVDQAQVLVDGKPVCEQVPCRLEGLSSGTHFVSVWAAGYERLEAQPIAVRGGVDSALQLTLARRNTAALRISTNVPGLSVRLDGEDRGPAPTTLHQLSPSEHTVRVQGNPGYAPFEQRVVLEADRTTTIEPQLVPLRTVLHLESGSGAEDARVELIRGEERREIRKLPADVELTPGAAYRVHASKKNFEDYDAEVSFEEGRPERSLTIALMPRERQGADGPVTTQRAALPGAAAATGTLSINSIPISSVLLDGRPVGSTPQRLSLSAGPHSLVFVHPTLGQKERSVRVAPGQTAVAAVRF
jgi:serine/threonine-protein kinase